DSGSCLQCVRIVAGSCSKESCGELHAQQCHARDLRRRARVMADARCRCGCLIEWHSNCPLSVRPSSQFTTLFTRHTHSKGATHASSSAFYGVFFSRPTTQNQKFSGRPVHDFISRLKLPEQKK